MHHLTYERVGHERLGDLVRRADVMPLGSAALAGCAFLIDRQALAAGLVAGGALPGEVVAVGAAQRVMRRFDGFDLLGGCQGCFEECGLGRCFGCGPRRHDFQSKALRGCRRRR